MTELTAEYRNQLNPRIVHLAKIWCKKIHSNQTMEIDDWVQEAWLLYPRALETWKEEGTAAFPTFFLTCIRNRFINIVRNSYSKEKESIRLMANDMLETRVTTVELPETSLMILEALTPMEVKYIRLMREDRRHRHRQEHRGMVRKRMSISTFREDLIRKSIRDKLTNLIQF